MSCILRIVGSDLRPDLLPNSEPFRVDECVHDPSNIEGLHYSILSADEQSIDELEVAVLKFLKINEAALDGIAGLSNILSKTVDASFFFSESKMSLNLTSNANFLAGLGKAGLALNFAIYKSND